MSIRAGRQTRYGEAREGARRTPAWPLPQGFMAFIRSPDQTDEVQTKMKTPPPHCHSELPPQYCLLTKLELNWSVSGSSESS